MNNIDDRLREILSNYYSERYANLHGPVLFKIDPEYEASTIKAIRDLVVTSLPEKNSKDIFMLEKQHINKESAAAGGYNKALSIIKKQWSNAI